MAIADSLKLEKIATRAILQSIFNQKWMNKRLNKFSQ